MATRPASERFSALPSALKTSSSCALRRPPAVRAVQSSSWQTARFPFQDMMRSVRLNVHMPLYYLLLKGWMAAFGESVMALRGFSITFGALTVIAMAYFGCELFRASSIAPELPPDRA